MILMAYSIVLMARCQMLLKGVLSQGDVGQAPFHLKESTKKSVCAKSGD
jgi:hypothetical protein